MRRTVALRQTDSPRLAVAELGVRICHQNQQAALFRPRRVIMHPSVTRGAELAEKLHVQEPLTLPSAGVVNLRRLPFADEAGRMRYQKLAPELRVLRVFGFPSRANGLDALAWLPAHKSSQNPFAVGLALGWLGLGWGDHRVTASRNASMKACAH